MFSLYLKACTVINILKYVYCIIFAISVKKLNVTLVEKSAFFTGRGQFYLRIHIYRMVDPMQTPVLVGQVL